LAEEDGNLILSNYRTAITAE
jgi:hypothetical protein